MSDNDAFLQAAKERLGPVKGETIEERVNMDDVEGLLELGYSQAKVAELYGISRTSLWRLLHPEKARQYEAEHPEYKAKRKAAPKVPRKDPFDAFMDSIMGWIPGGV